MTRTPFRTLFLCVLVSLGLATCIDGPETDSAEDLESTPLTREATNDRLVEFREAMRQRVHSAEASLEGLDRQLAEQHAPAREQWSGELAELRDTHAAVEVELRELETSEDSNDDEVWEELIRRVDDLDHGIDRIELQLPGSAGEFSEVLNERIDEIASTLGVLTQEVALLDDEVAEGYYDELRELEEERDEIEREASAFAAGLQEDSGEERNELTDELLDLLDDVQELEYELRWGLDRDAA